MAKPKQAKDTMLPDLSAVFAEQDKKLKEWREKERKVIEATLKPWDDDLAKVLGSVKL